MSSKTGAAAICHGGDGGGDDHDDEPVDKEVVPWSCEFAHCNARCGKVYCSSERSAKSFGLMNNEFLPLEIFAVEKAHYYCVPFYSCGC